MKLVCALGIGIAIAALLVAVGHAEPPAADASEEQQKTYWQNRHEQLAERVRDAGARVEATRAEYVRGRHHYKIRGENYVRVLTQIAKAESDLMEAQRELRGLPEEARRAGAPPGWLRELEEVPSAADLDRLLAEEASPPEQHEALARHLRARAVELRDTAESHRLMGFEYTTTKLPTAEAQREHCAKLAELESRLADEYDRLAEGHLAR